MSQPMMKALYYSSARNFTIKEVPIPKIQDDEVLLKVTYCGVCGTDAHIHEGEFISQFPLIPGHEAVGSLLKSARTSRASSRATAAWPTSA